MKTLFLLSMFFYMLPSAFAQCAGAPGAYHTNPDSSAGGFVAATAYVAPEVFLSADSQVCDSASVRGEARIVTSSIIRNFASISSDPSPANIIVA